MLQAASAPDGADRVESAGIGALVGAGADPHAVAVMDERRRSSSRTAGCPWPRRWPKPMGWIWPRPTPRNSMCCEVSLCGMRTAARCWACARRSSAWTRGRRRPCSSPTASSSNRGMWSSCPPRRWSASTGWSRSTRRSFRPFGRPIASSVTSPRGRRQA
nr:MULTISPECIES: hypothetical protein [unclassified Halorhodospira]